MVQLGNRNRNSILVISGTEHRNMFCSRDYQLTSGFNQQNEKSTSKRNSINLQIFHFRYGVPTLTRVQLSAWILQMQTPSRVCRCRGENYINAGDAYF